jgi:hypothetical protein
LPYSILCFNNIHYASSSQELKEDLIFYFYILYWQMETKQSSLRPTAGGPGAPKDQNIAFGIAPNGRPRTTFARA